MLQKGTTVTLYTDKANPKEIFVVSATKNDDQVGNQFVTLEDLWGNDITHNNGQSWFHESSVAVVADSSPLPTEG